MWAMSPLFQKSDDSGQGRKHGRLPSLYELGPQVDQVVAGIAAEPLEQFAAQLMRHYFTTDWLVASQITSMVAVDTVCWDLLPDNSGEHLSEPIPDAFFSLQDLVTEAVQLLQTAGLVMERSYRVGQEHGSGSGQWLSGIVTTRRGRSALASGTVEQVIYQAYAQHG
jgi:hypothetical protein